MLMMIGKGIRGGICHAIYRYAKRNNKIWKVIINALNYHTLCI